MGSTENRTKTRDKDWRGGRAIAVEDARVSEHHDSPPTAVGLIDLIDAPQHVRELDPEHVRSLAGSIALQGVVVPIVVPAAGERYELVAGSWAGSRQASCRRDDPGQADDRACEGEGAGRATCRIAVRWRTHGNATALGLAAADLRSALPRPLPKSASDRIEARARFPQCSGTNAETRPMIVSLTFANRFANPS